MCTEIDLCMNPENPAEILPVILAFLLSVIQAGTPTGILAGVYTEIPTECHSNIPPCMTPEIHPAFPAFVQVFKFFFQNIIHRFLQESFRTILQEFH